MTLPIDLVFVRHGQSEGNEAKRRSEKGDHTAFSPDFRGRHNSSLPLTDLGRSQVQIAGDFLKKEFVDKGNVFDRMYVSEYIRAKETAGLLDLSDAEWHCDSYLTERDWGDIDMLPDHERQKRFGEALRKRDADPFFWRPPGGESFNDLSLRVDRFLDTLHRECPDKRVLVVCHGEVMRAVQVRLERLSQNRFRELISSTNPHDRIHNCQITHYTRRNPRSNKIVPFVGWVKWMRPADDPPEESDWNRIIRKKYSNEELLAEVAKVPPIVN